MTITLYHHPFSRAASTLWALEEVGVPYDLRFVDFRTNEQKSPDILSMNPMGKLPILVDGNAVVTEVAAIALYLADRYAPGKLAPAIDDPARGTYLRWSFFAPSVIEPGSMAKSAHWEFKPSSVGWGDHAAMLDALEKALTPGPYILGDRFSMADVILGGTVGYMLRFGMLEARPVWNEYVERISARPAKKAADARNGAVVVERGLAT